MSTDYFHSPRYGGTKKFSQQEIYSANATGFGAAADDYMERGIDLNEELIRNKPATFFMRVSSDVMRESGIYKGDVVIVDRSLKAINGRIVIAILNGEFLIRRFEKNESNILLMTDHHKLAPIIVDVNCGDFAIWGVVTYVIHKV